MNREGTNPRVLGPWSPYVDHVRARLALPWKPVGAATAIWTSVALFGAAYVLRASEGFVPVLDHANLAFHEAGHPLFGLFGATLALYGGTLGQLVFPIATTVSFVWQRRPVAAAFTGVWFSENFLNIARYAADARAQELPLVGGGEHDWFHILTRWHALDSDLRVAAFFRLVAWAGVAAAWTFVLWRARLDAREARLAAQQAHG